MKKILLALLLGVMIGSMLVGCAPKAEEPAPVEETTTPAPEPAPETASPEAAAPTTEAAPAEAK